MGQMTVQSLLTDDLVPIVTQSAVKTYRMCKREFYYKYILNLSPRVSSIPLTRGKWFHELLETYYSARLGGVVNEDAPDWQTTHKKWCGRFAKLFDEEKEKLGDLPRELENLMTSYLWHYKNDAGWIVHEVEKKLDVKLPNGMILRLRIDMLIEDDYGLWIVDHKSQKRMTPWEHRIVDEQSPLYVWAFRQIGIPVRGFIWNTVSTAGMSVPRVLASGKRFSKSLGTTDYPTYARAVKAALRDYEGVFLTDPADRRAVNDMLRYLKGQRYNPDAQLQTSPHFQRDVIERSEEMIMKVVNMTCRTAEDMHTYDFSNDDLVERSTTDCRGNFCSFRSLNIADLVTGDRSRLQRIEYVERNPLAYYEDEEKEGI